jgi:poly [ADP-ribose] polymerase 6/8
MSRKRLREDITNATSKFGESIRDLTLEDESITFGIGDKAKFTLMVGDYPSMSVLYIEGVNDPDVVEGNLDSILTALVRRFGGASKSANKSTSTATTTAASANASTTEGVDSGARPVSLSLLSSGSLSESDGAWRGGSDTWDNAPPVERDWQSVPLLKSDVEQCRAVVGEQCVSVVGLAVLEKFDVTVAIDIHAALSHHTASAWGIDASSPLYLTLQLADHYTESITAPDFKLYQRVDGTKRDFRLQFQLSNIMSAFIKRNWPKYVARSPDIMNAPGPRNANASSAAAAATSSKSNATTSKRTDEILAQLLEMGFAAPVSERLAKVCESVDDALRLLEAGGGDVTMDALLSYSVEVAERTQEPAHKVPRKPVAAKPTSIFNEAAADAPGRHQGATESASRGFFTMCYWYLCERLQTCNDFCVICDQHHVFQHGAMLKPSICSRDLCVWSYQQLGVAAGAETEVASSASLIDLLMRLAQHAANSRRNTLIFNPYPHLFDPTDRSKVLFNPAAHDFGKLQEVLNSFPPMAQVANAGDAGKVKTLFEQAHPHAFLMMQWLVSSNRTHIVAIAPQFQLPSMGTPHQFLMLSATPEHEARFQEARAQYGSTFSFHGSPVENWHSILRTGLRNASNTNLMINAAAYGAGVYNSPQAATSLGYCRSNISRHASPTGGFLGANMVCMALCEVVQHDLRKNGTIWVQPHEHLIVTRFFFVWEHTPTQTVAAIDTQAPKGIVTEIRAALKAHGLDYGEKS